MLHCFLPLLVHTLALIKSLPIVHVSDNALSERMQIDPDLMLEQAKGIGRQRDAVQEQRGNLQGGMQPALFEVRRLNTQPGKPMKYLPIGGPRRRSSVANKQCSR